MGAVWTTGGLGAFGGVVETESYEQLCTTPCSADVKSGTQKLALSREDGKQIPAEPLLSIQGPATVEGKYESYAGMRIAGWILGLGGLTVMVLAPVAARTSCSLTDGSCEPYDGTVPWGTLGGGFAVATAGLFMALKKDEATVSIRHGLDASLRRDGLALTAPAGARPPVGLTGTFRF